MDRTQHEWSASVVRTPITPLKDWSWPDGTASVVEFLDGRGARWIVKRHRFDERYRTERTASERWVPAIADRAPKLAATDDTLRTLLLSSLPRDDRLA